MAKVNYFISKPNWNIFFIYLGILLFGNIVIKDIMVYRSIEPIIKNFLYSSIAIVSALMVSIIDIELLKKYSFKILFLFFVPLLIFIIFRGHESHGAIRALRIGPISIQVSMFVLNFIIIYLAKVIQVHQEKIEDKEIKNFFTSNFGFPLIAIMLIFLLIYFEKHLSILIIAGLTIFTMLVVAGFRKRVLLSIIVLGLLLVFFAIFKGGENTSYRAGRMDIYKKYSLFSPVRKELQNKKIDKQFQIEESLKALANGGMWGKKHPISIHSYLPEVNNDYVFSFIGEQKGFIISAILLIVYFILFYTGMKESSIRDDLFLKLCLVGFSSSIFINVLVNIGVSMSALPSTGVNLPFVSTGGSALVANSITVGLMLNISRLRD